MDTDNDDHDGEYNKLLLEAENKLNDLMEWKNNIEERQTHVREMNIKNKKESKELEELKNLKQKVLVSISLLEKTVEKPETKV